MKNDNIYWNHNTFYYKWIKEQIKPNSKVLDVGCGDGTLAFYLKDVCKEIIGIDPFKECIDTAKDLYSKYNNINFINTSFEDFKYDSEVFDAIIFVASIHHMDMINAIDKAKKSKKPVLIEVNTTIGKYSKYEGTNKIHGKLDKDDLNANQLNDGFNDYGKMKRHDCTIRNKLIFMSFMDIFVTMFTVIILFFHVI